MFARSCCVFRTVFRESGKLRNLYELKPVLSANPVNNFLFLNNGSNSTLQSVRFYAKGKDKKKEKPKKSAKQEINENQLREFINLDSLNTQMQKVVDAMREEFVKNLSIRTNTNAIESIKVEVDGKRHLLQELGQVIRKSPKLIMINLVSFPETIPAVLKALEKSGMNLNPQQDGTTLFIPVPVVTTEHRENLAKNAKMLFIKCRDGIKDVQNSTIKKLKRNTTISSDDNHSIQNQLVTIADSFISQAEKMLELKQKELLDKID